MRMDWKIIRGLLEKFEDESISDYLSTVGALPDSVQLENFDTRENLKSEAKAQEKLIFGHLLLCLDGEFVEGLQIKTGTNFDYSYGLCSPRLTLRGHELLEKLKNRTVWEKVKSGAASLGVPLTVETISAIATKVTNDL